MLPKSKSNQELVAFSLASLKLVQHARRLDSPFLVYLAEMLHRAAVDELKPAAREAVWHSGNGRRTSRAR